MWGLPALVVCSTLRFTRTRKVGRSAWRCVSVAWHHHACVYYEYTQCSLLTTLSMIDFYRAYIPYVYLPKRRCGGSHASSMG